MKRYVNLADHADNFKSHEKVSELAKSVAGLTHSEWMLLKEVVDGVFKVKVANVQIDDSDELAMRLAFEFSGLNMAQKAMLLKALNEKQS